MFKIHYIITFIIVLIAVGATDVFAVDSILPDGTPLPSQMLKDDELSKDNSNEDQKLHYPLKSASMQSYEDLSTITPMDLKNPKNVTSGVDYDPLTSLYFFHEKVGDMDVVTPFSMTQQEYLDYSQKQSLRDYWRDKTAKDTETDKKKAFSLTNMQFDIGKADKVFGPGGVQVKMQGSAELLFGFKINKVQNPSLSERMRNPSPIFDFDEKIQLNVNGKVGDRVNFTMNYNTEASFDFDQSKIKLTYDGKEDDIIKHIEAGNVSMPLNSSLIRGSSALFGIKSELQFGRLNVTSVISQQESSTKTVSLKNGAQTSSFEITADDYDENRHFFLSHYFRDNFEKAMSQLPYVNSNIKINRLEVWVTNKKSDYTSARNVVAFLDLGETDHLKNNNHWTLTGNQKNPYNKVNSLYDEVAALTDIRNIDDVTSVLDGALGSADIVGGDDYEKVESARKLEPTEYSLNAELGYISLRSQLSSDDVLAVAYEYTMGGKTYQVGEFSSDGIEAPNTLIVKLIKGTSFSPSLANWDLMMKNVYSLGASQIQSTDFDLQVKYASDSSGVDVNYLPEGTIKNKALLKVLKLDRLNTRSQAHPDGKFDFVDGYTIQASTGKIIFPVLEPFGSDLKAAIGDEAIAKKYVYQELYDLTKSDAQEYTEKNKFKLVGSYKGSSNAEIRLDAMNVPQGSVTVTAGGVTLTENVDYTVDYSMGTVTILNQSILESGSTIDVSLESQSIASMQTKTLLGTHLEYQFNKDFSVGGTLMHLSEKPVTTKVSTGEEPISNTIWGANFNYKHESQTLTNWIDKLPFIKATTPSSMVFSGEFAQLIPGHSSVIGSAGYSYIDDFESSKTSINILYPYSWYLSSTPSERFPEAAYSNNVDYGKNRALMAWFTIDPLFNTSTSSTPSYIKNDKEQLSNHFVRAVEEQEIFPNKETIPGQTSTLSTLNISYYPTERGPYNLDADNINANGSLKNPSARWGGMMRKLDVTDFEAANVEYIEFWMLDPFVYDESSVGGDMYFDLGEVSEDILKDGKKSFENGLSATGDTTATTSTVWGRVPKTQSVVNAFDNDASSRVYQDVGLDGLRNVDEYNFPTYRDFLAKYKAKLSATALDSLQKDPASVLNDPSGDYYHYYRGSDFDDEKASILQRYKYYNGMEGNSPVSASSTDYSSSATNIPNAEDINSDNTMNEYEKYYEYKVSLRPKDMVVGQNHIVDKIISNVSLKNGKTEPVTWYQFRIPVDEYESYVGSPSLKSIRFMRMYLTNFSKEVQLRFATLELVRGDWKTYLKNLYDANNPPTTTNTELAMSVVNIEENASKKPVNYVLPPGVDREQDPSQTSVVEENEQSLLLKVSNLSPGDARAVYKKTNYDMRQYKRLQMFVHAEKFIDDVTDLQNSELTAFVRLGSDLTSNYYEYEVPLQLTPAGVYSEADGSSDREIVWPTSNMIDFPFSLLTDVKKDRNKDRRSIGSAVSLTTKYSEYDPDNTSHKVSVVGNPSLADVQHIMIGIRNQSRNVKSAEVWVNELRMKGFNEDGGYAAMGSATVNLSDMGSVNMSGRMETAGFGGIEDNIADRRMDDYTQFNISTNLDLGRFLPEKAKVKMPIYAAYSNETTTPLYNPYDDDLKLDDCLSNLNSDAEKDSLKNVSQTVYTTKSFNITNMKVDIHSKNPKIYDPGNFSFTYAYTESSQHDPDVLRNVTKDYKGALNYQYTTNPTPWEPFKKIKALKRPAFRLISDFNLYYYPSSIAFNTSMIRQYTEEQDRKLESEEVDYNDPNNSLLSCSKDFVWNRAFDLKYDLTRDLKFTYNCASEAQIQETKYAPVNKELFPTEYQNWKDTVWQSIKDGGIPLDYQQTFTSSFSAPFSKIPILNWATLNVNYTGNYTWERGALTEEDENDGLATSSMGNNITSLGTWQWDGRLNFEQFYNKMPYLKRANQRFLSRNNNMSKPNENTDKKTQKKEQKLTLKAGEKQKLVHRLNNMRVKVKFFDENQKELKVKYKVIDRNIIEINPKETAVVNVVVEPMSDLNENPKGIAAVAQASSRVLMMVRNFSFSYSQCDGMTIAGFKPSAGLFGLDGDAPGTLFAFGTQSDDWLNKAYQKNWLVTGDSTISPATKTHTQDLSLKMTLEPIPGLKIDLGAQRNYSTSTSIQYMYDGMPETMTGSFSMTTIALGTLFSSTGDVDNNYYSSVYETFKSNRTKALAMLEGKYSNMKYPTTGFMTSGTAATIAGQQFNSSNGTFSQNSAEVLIPSFLSAYTGCSLTADNLELIPSLMRMLPNWRITYDGLSRIPFIKSHFKSVNLTHSYVCKYNVGSFSSYSDWVSADGGYWGFTQNVSSGLPVPSSHYDVSAVSITESFSPLLRIDATFKNSLTVSGEYGLGRTLSLNVSSTQLVESSNKTYTLGLGYKISNFDVILKLKNDKESKVSNDLNLRLDLSKKSTEALIRKLDDESVTQATSGEDIFSADFSAEYIFSSKLTFRLYYDMQTSTPLISSSYPTSSHNFGMSIKILLTR